MPLALATLVSNQSPKVSSGPKASILVTCPIPHFQPDDQKPLYDLRVIYGEPCARYAEGSSGYVSVHSPHPVWQTWAFQNARLCPRTLACEVTSACEFRTCTCEFRSLHLQPADDVRHRRDVESWKCGGSPPCKLTGKLWEREIICLSSPFPFS